jgi:hypothetical protein
VLYRVTFRSNPLLILMPVVAVGLPALGVLIWRGAGPWVGLIAMGLAIYGDVRVLAYFSTYLRSWVETTNEEIIQGRPDGVTLSLTWASVTHAGAWTRRGQGRMLFVYDEKQEKLLSIPQRLSGFEALQEDIRRRLPEGVAFTELTLETGQGIEGWLRQHPQEQ